MRLTSRRRGDMRDVLSSGPPCLIALPLAPLFSAAFTKAVAGAITAIPEAISIMPLEIAKISLQVRDVTYVL